jgi:ubiquinone biosynthesis protein COQ9
MNIRSSPRDEKRHAIVQHAVKIACFDGWNEATITKAAVAAGFPALEGRRLFPEGVSELLGCYADMIDAMLVEKAATVDLSAMRVHDRIAWLVRTRLELIAPHKEAIRRAASWLLLRERATLVHGMWDVSDVMWRLAGDNSTDINYYTKRMLLMKVYASTLIFWLNDESTNHAESWEFLNRCIQGVLVMGKHMGKTRASLSAAVEGMADQLLNRKKYRTKR